jgi:hypothetical protein
MGDHVGVIRRMQTPDNQPFRFVQTLAETQLTQTNSVQYYTAGYGFAQIPQYSSFAAIFDQYKIEEIQVVFRPMLNAVGQVNPNVATGFIAPQLYTVVDYDDSATPSSIAQLESYANCNVSMYETVAITFTPHIAVGGAYGSSFTQYTNMEPQWIDCSSPNVTHYGIKAGCDGGDTSMTNFQVWLITTRVRVAFRNVR